MTLKVEPGWRRVFVATADLFLAAAAAERLHIAAGLVDEDEGRLRLKYIVDRFAENRIPVFCHCSFVFRDGLIRLLL